MKKFMKVCAIVALVMIVVGAVIGAIAGHIAGSAYIQEMVDSVTGGRVHLGLGAGDFGISVLDKLEEKGKFEISSNMDFDEDHPVMTGEIAERFAADEIKNLDIDAGACHMVFQPVSGDEFLLETENAGKVQCYVKSETLHVKVIRRTQIGHHGHDDTCRVTLYIPAGFQFKNADIEIGAGQLEFADMKAKTAEIEVGAGNVLCSGTLTADQLELKIGAGGVELAGAELEKLEAKIGVGALNMLKAKITKKAEIDCSMGSVQMTLAGSEKDYNYDLESAAGEMKVGSYETAGLVGDRKIDNKADCDIKAECSMGSVHISFTE